ncbi:O-antigen ligase family protein [Citrobacter braakii]|nr:O-antigen ligase family protein [Citrobacter braakii]
MIVNLRREYTYKSIVCLLIAFYFLVLMHIYLPNRGGSGLDLPLNIFAWGWICVLMCIICFGNDWHHIFYPHSIIHMIFGVLLLSIPLLWDSKAGLINAGSRIVALWGCLCVYFILYQLKLCFAQKIMVMWGIFGGIVIETIVALWQIGQLLIGGGDHPGGIFQQSNVLATFLATGLAISFVLHQVNKSLWGKIILALSQIIISMVLVLLFSRIGWLAGTLIYVLYLWRSVTKQHYINTALLYPVLGMGIGIGIMSLDSSLLVDKEASTHLRWLLLSATWSMIKANPLSGIGYGEYAYTLLRNLPVPQAKEAWQVTHPHNEVLYWWVEGGLLAITGIGYIVFSVMRQIITLKWRENFIWLYVMLPIMLHTMTEFPLGLSMPHLFILLIFISFFRGKGSSSMIMKNGSALLVRISSGFCFLLLVPVFIYMSQANFYLYLFERNGMNNEDYLAHIDFPILQWERYQFDRNVSMLLSYNTTRDEKTLIEFERWANDYSYRHNDKNICLTRVKIAKHFRLEEKSSVLKRECDALYP